MNIFGMVVQTDESMLPDIVKFVKPDGSDQTLNISTGEEVIEC